MTNNVPGNGISRSFCLPANTRKLTCIGVPRSCDSFNTSSWERRQRRGLIRENLEYLVQETDHCHVIALLHLQALFRHRNPLIPTVGASAQEAVSKPPSLALQT